LIGVETTVSKKDENVANSDEAEKPTGKCHLKQIMTLQTDTIN